MLGDAALVYTLSPCHHSVKLLSKHVPTTYDNCTPPLHLCLHNLPHVHTLQSVFRESTACGTTNISFDELPVRFMEALSCNADMVHKVYCLQTSSMTDEECLFKHSTCCQFKSFKIEHFASHQLKSIKIDVIGSRASRLNTLCIIGSRVSRYGLTGMKLLTPSVMFSILC